MKYTIQHRRGTATQWDTANPILASAEIGVELSTTDPRFKIGDGEKTWTTLPYADDKALAAAFAAATNAIDHADTGDVTTLISAKTYADSGDSGTLSSAKAYTDTRTTGLLNLLADTGERNVTSLFTGISGGQVFVSRTGRDVMLRFENMAFASAGTQTGIGQLPDGFRPRPTHIYLSTAQRSQSSSPVKGGRISRYGSVDMYDVATGQTYYGAMTWKSFDTFPTTLPGTPA